MSESGKRPGGRGGPRRDDGKPGRPRRDGDSPRGRGQGGQGGSRGQGDSRGRPPRDRSDDRPSGDRPAGHGRPAGAGDSRGYRSKGREPEEVERTEDQLIYDGPPIPDEVSAKDLDQSVRDHLRALPDKLADRIARHLVMAGLLLESDPETAYKHALAARARSQRSAVIREAVGETAYAAGKFAEALAELRTARRLSGGHDYAPMMADCERALGRPQKALEYDRPEVRAGLDDAGEVELTIVVAGARRDLGQAAAALRMLESEPLHSPSREPWLARLRYAYADTLLAAGRRDEAVEWFHRTLAVDGDGVTDAEERLAELE
jgi:tetratricopeptide (TPR) repeat protein